MTENRPAPRSALTPTALPLSPQDIHPAELAALLAEAAERRAEAEAALLAAEDHFNAAEQRHQYALTEEAKRAAREEQAVIQKLRDLHPSVEDDVARFRRQFYEACAEETVDPARVMELFTYWERYRSLVMRVRQRIIGYDSTQSRDDYLRWERRVAGWGELLRTVMSWRKGGTLAGDDDDVEGLAAVNKRISEESQEAPRPLSRDAADLAVPYIEDLGLRDPARASWYGEIDLRPLEFNDQFSKAVAEGASDWARRAYEMVVDKGREEFAAAAAASLETKDS